MTTPVTGLRAAGASDIHSNRCERELAGGSNPVRIRVERSGSLVGTPIPLPLPVEGPTNCSNVPYLEAAL